MINNNYDQETQRKKNLTKAKCGVRAEQCFASSMVGLTAKAHLDKCGVPPLVSFLGGFAVCFATFFCMKRVDEYLENREAAGNSRALATAAQATAPQLVQMVDADNHPHAV